MRKEDYKEREEVTPKTLICCGAGWREGCVRAVGDGASARRLEWGAVGQERRGAGWGWGSELEWRARGLLAGRARAPSPGCPPPGGPFPRAPLLAPGGGGGLA